MPVHNAQIAATFDTLADLLEIEEANPFRVRAYRNAARIIENMPQELADLLASGKDLSEFPGIGKDLAGKIATIVETGTLPLLDEVERRTPEALSQLTHIAGLGPKRVRSLYERLHVQSVDDLARAVEKQQVRELPGFGAKTEESIRLGLQRMRGQQQRMKLIDAEQIAEPLQAWLKSVPGVAAVQVAGSYRRRRETVGDLDVLVTCDRQGDVMDRFIHHPEVVQVVARGETRSTVRFGSGLQVDLRVVPQSSFGAALHYFTGSKAHNIAIRKLAVKRQLKINEYGVFSGEKRIAGRTEEEVFAQVGLPFIEPELREDRGEVEAAAQGRLPQLVSLEQIRGDLHLHTKATDGRYSLEEMVRAAAELGYAYVAVTDHSRRVTMAKGLDESRLAEQLTQIDALQEKFPTIRILKGIELDILEDGTLDLPDRILKRLDLRVCSVHYQHALPRERQTERIIRAMDNPYFNILAHPSGRLINEREPYEVEMERIVEAAAERGCFIELNAQPSRLDATDSTCMLAKEHGVKVAISTDAHSIGDLRFMRFGIGQARRGWLEAADVLNTRPLEQLLKLFKRT